MNFQPESGPALEKKMGMAIPVTIPVTIIDENHNSGQFFLEGE